MDYYLPTTKMAQYTTTQLATTSLTHVDTSPPTTTSSASTTSPATTAKLYYTTSQFTTTTEAAVSISLSITASGTNTAGQTYRLECSATVTGSPDQPTFTWLDPINNPVPSVMVTTTGSTSTLTFSPLTVSNAGTYTCRVTAGGVTETQTTTVVLNGIILLLLVMS